MNHTRDTKSHKLATLKYHFLLTSADSADREQMKNDYRIELILSRRERNIGKVPKNDILSLKLIARVYFFQTTNFSTTIFLFVVVFGSDHHSYCDQIADSFFLGKEVVLAFHFFKCSHNTNVKNLWWIFFSARIIPLPLLRYGVRNPKKREKKNTKRDHFNDFTALCRIVQ